jgi:unsaturated rhamnogalacturonyl hydrolase
VSNPELEPIIRRLADRTIELGFRQWGWGEGVAQYGLLEAGAALDERRYVDEVGQFLESNRDFQPTLLEHVMPSLSALLHSERTGEPIGRYLTDRVATMLLNHPRSHHGAWTVTPVRTVWVDYIYETAPMLVNLARISGNRLYEEWAIDQTLAYLMSCYNPREKLFHHVYYDDVAAPNPFIWARANGWTALGLVEMLDLLPAQYGLRPTLTRYLRHMADRLAELQDDSGHWHTVLLDDTTHREASTSAMLALAFKRGVRSGWLSARFEETADRAWDAVVREIDDEGNLTNTSAETPPGDADDYQAIEVGVYGWGQGFALLAAVDRYRNT